MKRRVAMPLKVQVKLKERKKGKHVFVVHQNPMIGVFNGQYSRVA